MFVFLIGTVLPGAVLKYIYCRFCAVRQYLSALFKRRLFSAVVSACGRIYMHSAGLFQWKCLLGVGQLPPCGPLGRMNGAVYHILTSDAETIAQVEQS